MRFSLPILSFAATAYARARSLDLSDLYVNKYQDPDTRRIKVNSLLFTLNGYRADNITCEHGKLPTFPSDVFRCNNDSTGYRFVLHQGTEGSGSEFGVGLYYDNTEEK